MKQKAASINEVLTLKHFWGHRCEDSSSGATSGRLWLLTTPLLSFYFPPLAPAAGCIHQYFGSKQTHAQQLWIQVYKWNHFKQCYSPDSLIHLHNRLFFFCCDHLLHSHVVSIVKLTNYKMHCPDVKQEIWKHLVRGYLEVLPLFLTCWSLCNFSDRQQTILE